MEASSRRVASCWRLEVKQTLACCSRKLSALGKGWCLLRVVGVVCLVGMARAIRVHRVAKGMPRGIGVPYRGYVPYV